MNARPAVIVLAAGRGSRFQGIEHKLAQPLGRMSVLQTTVSNARASGLPVLVVTTRELLNEVGAFAIHGDVLLLPEAGSHASLALGMGYSIAAGVAARSDASGWLILPGDMPLVQPSTLHTVAQALSEHTIVYAQHHGLRGHPVGFSGELYSELVRLEGDQNARRMLARYPGHEVDVNDPGVLIDIDTSEDLERARHTLATSSHRATVSPFDRMR